jgi:hypothetical protein
VRFIIKPLMSLQSKRAIRQCPACSCQVKIFFMAVDNLHPTG